MKKIIIANWKMNPPTPKEAERLFGEIKKTVNKLKKTQTVICPPSVYLSVIGGGKSNLIIGAQDVFYEEIGGYTGENSISMMKSLGVKYIIVGHSKRRDLGETDDIVNKKVKIILRNGLKAVLCVGEKERDKEGEYLKFIKNQIIGALKGVQKKDFKNLIIAYEPVWAISTNKGGHSDDPNSSFEVAVFIRKSLMPIIGASLARTAPILYGGSVNSKNADGFLHKAGMQGALVGGASLKAKEFGVILEQADKN